jgi:hypothetical protein
MLSIQDPNFPDSYTLHESFLSIASESNIGYGMFAFASKSGVELLFNDASISPLLSQGEFNLIVGIDEITNERCLNTLQELEATHSGLLVKAFLNNVSGSLFHPKFSLFEKPDGTGTLIVGSGNLTLGGLRRNREAFSQIELLPEQLAVSLSKLNSWKEQYYDVLLDISEERVLERARSNFFKARRAKIQNSNESEIPEPETVEEYNDIVDDLDQSWTFNRNSTLLIAEIPKSGDRWKQANFSKGIFEDFFGATPGDNSQRILLRHIDSQGQLEEIEVRPSVSVASQNYRFELDAASGIDYPDTGKPIGVFFRITTRMFLYHLTMPGSELNEYFSDWLGQNWSGRQDRMKRILTPASNLNDIIVNSILSTFDASN